MQIVCPPARLTVHVLLVTALQLALAAPARAKSVKHYDHNPCTRGNRWPGCVKKHHSLELRPYEPKKREDLGLKDTMTETGRTARGFWITPYYLHRIGAERIARAMKKNGLNAAVIDTKDDFGRILWPSSVPLARELQVHLLPNPKKTIETFHKHGIYVIARFVTFKDSRLPYVRPDLGARIGPRARRLLNAQANWIDPYAMEVQDYVIDLALELQELGFDEIQFDYIRFPKGTVSRLGTWLHNRDGTPRGQVILGFLERADRALRIPISTDVYGLTTLVDGDARSLGQDIQDMAKYVEAISPMMYANGMDTYFKNNKVTEHVYNVIQCGLWRARKKAAAISLRPYLQAYPNNVEHLYGPEFIRRQLVAARRAGSDGFLFWNPAMRMGTVYRGLALLGQKNVLEFGDDTVGRHQGNEPGEWCKKKGAVFSKRRGKRAGH